jgi:PhoH-like ATPase
MPRNKALSSKNYVLDTNILLHEPLAFLSFKENDVVVPMTVLEELDSIKGSKKNGSKKNVAKDTRVSIRAMEDLLHDATPEELMQGVSMQGKGAGEAAPTGSLSIFVDHGMPVSQQK